MANKGFTIWLTGLSGAGKTTISSALAKALTKRQVDIEMLDGDIVRENLSKGLTFSKEDRDINVLRIGFVAELLTKHGVGVIVSAISPYRGTREMVRKKVKDFVEVYVCCSVEECERRDVKGLYQKARNGELKNFTGIDDPYEAPINPEVICATEKETLEESVNKIMSVIESLGYINNTSESATAFDNEFSLLNK